MMLSSSVRPHKQCCTDFLTCFLFNTILVNELALYFRKTHKKVLSVNKIIIRHTDDSVEEKMKGKKYSRTYDPC